jgi:hypothetical protein
MVAPIASASKPRVVPNCKAVNKVHAPGIAKNFKVIKTANGLTGVRSSASSSTQPTRGRLDRDGDGDGVACET